MILELTKHHGLGNDFLVVFAPDLPDPAEVARRLCDRRRGIGADGLLVGEPLDREIDDADVRMVLYNADGSRAMMSGNGIRCFAQAYASREQFMRDLVVSTDAGLRTVAMRPTHDPSTIEASVDMGEITRIEGPANWSETGCHPERPVLHLGVGNPHSVVGVDDVTVVDLAALGAVVPDVNLEIVEPGPEPHGVTMRVHERGAGITEACGTGACATAFAARAWGLVTALDGAVVVHMDGGDVSVTLDQPEPGRATLTGPSTYVATILVEVPDPDGAGSSDRLRVVR